MDRHRDGHRVDDTVTAWTDTNMDTDVTATGMGTSWTDRHRMDRYTEWTDICDKTRFYL